MLGGPRFEHHLLRKYVVLFGTLFNDISITRKNEDDQTVQAFKVPISYGPREKFLAMVKQKPDKKERAIQLPRMSFEIAGMSWDGTRKFNRNNKVYIDGQELFEPAPWNIDFELSILSKSDLDATKIIEQALYYFNPEWNLRVKLLDNVERHWDIPIVYNGVQHQDVYEGDFIQRRSLLWTISFTMKAYLHGPTSEGKVIKFVRVNTHPSFEAEDPTQILTVQPGLTSDGQPTTDINQTIYYRDIEADDNWDYIVQIEEKL